MIAQNPKRKRLGDIFVLTAEEKRTVSFVVVMLVLGIATAHYRRANSQPAPKSAVADTAMSAARPAQKRAEAKRLNVTRAPARSR